MEFHPIAKLFPMMPDDERLALAEDIATHGQREPVYLFEGKVLDGRNRVLACEQAGVQVKSKEFKGSRSDAIAFVWSENLHRRHLTSSQAAMALAERKKMDPDFMRAVVEPLKEEAKERQRDGGKSAGRGRPKQVRKKVSEAIRPREKVAKIHGTNATTVAECEKIISEHPEHVEAIKSGAKSVTQVKREIKESARDEKRKTNAAKAKTAEKLSDVVGKFATIVVDPPWDWGDEGDVNQLGRAKADFATMPFSDLMALPVEGRADDDCHLYLWITNRSLPKGFALIEKWGFRYVTCLTWCKPSFGMGNYFRGSTEHVLFAVRGSQALKRKNVGTWHEWPRPAKKHSAKPPEFLELVESCSPGPYLELFARSKRDGWTSWGADA
jgi:N6-adenosine-specific RNA methylase IME4